jgi:hypothetical protein
MPHVVSRGESVYKCSICNRKIRVPTNKKGLDIINYCTITSGCKGKLNRVTLIKDINETPALTPAENNVNDWFQRKTLYTHIQTVTSNIWNIPHNLNGKPNIHTFLNKMVNNKKELVSVLQPTTTIIDSNNIRLTFDRTESGLAQLVTLSSSNITNPLLNTTTSISSSNVLMSTSTGLISIGTLNTDSIISIELTFIIAGHAPIVILYDGIDNIPSITSPWSDVNVCFLNGKSYTVRSLEIISHLHAINYFLTGQIPPQGCSFYISKVNNVIPAYNDIIMLGVKYPFTSVDKIYDNYVNFSAETSSSRGIIYSFGQIYATPTTLKPVFPYITVV